MPTELLTPLGPLFGPSLMKVALTAAGRQFDLHIYGDANNEKLRANGMARRYYYVPQQVYLARKGTASNDFDFGMTIFKGLMTGESILGITEEMITDGNAEIGGGFITFSTTFALPNGVVTSALEQIKASSELHSPGEISPELGIVAITENNVTIEVPDLAKVGTTKIPFFISAQGSGRGSIDAAGISTFLVTCNQMAAGAIAGSLKEGKSPFTIHNNLKQMFYLTACQISVVANVSKVHDQFSAALSAGGFLGINSIALSYAYEKTVTSGAITTTITMNGAAVPEELKNQLMKQADDMKKRIMDLVAKEIFDWTPTSDPPATASRGPFSGLFGGASLSMKAKHEVRQVDVSDNFELKGTIAIEDMKAGDLNDLETAIRSNLDKYLSIVDIGEFFKKIQVAATCNANWNEKLPDGTDISDPIKSILFQTGYPDISGGPGANGQPNLIARTEGFHYKVGEKQHNRPNELCRWTKANPDDIVNFSYMRLSAAQGGWNPGQVKMTKTLVFNVADPRVDLANGTDQITTEVITDKLAPVVSPADVGYVFVRFEFLNKIVSDAITVKLHCTIGNRNETLTIKKSNPNSSVIWQIFSDKYFEVDSFSYTVDLIVTGPGFLDRPVKCSSRDPIVVPIPKGRIKYITNESVDLPPISSEQETKINDYLKRATL